MKTLARRKRHNGKRRPEGAASVKFPGALR
jgi:hypothetical protein